MGGLMVNPNRILGYVFLCVGIIPGVFRLQTKLERRAKSPE